jgi:hypothetical protein
MTNRSVPLVPVGMTTANVVRVGTEADAGRVLIDDGMGEPAWASTRVAGLPSIEMGDRVLTAGTIGGERFVLALLLPQDGSPPRARTAGAATVITVEGDLELHAPNGSVRIDARDGLKLTAPHVSLRTDDGDAGGAEIAPTSRLEMSRGSIALEGPALKARTHDASLEARDATVRTKRWALVADRAIETVGNLEIRASRIVERAKDVFREVEDQMHVRAGSIREVARDTLQFLSRRALIRATEDAKIKAEKIYLG